MTGCERRVRPLEQQGARAWLVGDPADHGGQPLTEPSGQLAGLLLAPGGPAQRADGVEYLGERVRVDGQDLGGAAEVVEGRAHGVDVDRADGAEVLGDDQVRVEAAQRSRVEVVEVVAVAHRLRHEGVDLGRPQSVGQRGGRHDRAAPGLRRGVALERHADHLVARAEREQDLGGRRQQRDDAHGGSLSRASPVVEEGSRTVSPRRSSLWTTGFGARLRCRWSLVEWVHGGNQRSGDRGRGPRRRRPARGRLARPSGSTVRCSCSKLRHRLPVVRAAPGHRRVGYGDLGRRRSARAR